MKKYSKEFFMKIWDEVEKLCQDINDKKITIKESKKRYKEIIKPLDEIHDDLSRKIKILKALDKSMN